MREAQTRLQPNDRLAVDMEAEMSGLYDARVHRADRNLVQHRAPRLGGEELVSRCGNRRDTGARWLRQRPSPMVEPRPTVDRPFGLQSEEVAGHALEPAG